MTIWRELTVQTVARVACAASRSRGRQHESLPYLPGSALRGALAAAYLADGSAGDDLFLRLSSGCRFANLQPAGDGETAAYPVPLSAFTCNHSPGFLADGGHGISDTLLVAEASALVRKAVQSQAASNGVTSPGEAQAVPVNVDALVQCPRCQGERRRGGPSALRPADGLIQWRRDTPRGVTIRYGQAGGRPVSSLTGNSTSPPYVHEVIAEGQRFSAPVGLDDAVATHITQQLAPRGSVLWLGAGRSRGLGAVAVEAWRDVDPPQPLEQRVEGLNERMRLCAARIGGSPPSETYVTLTLRSPAIVRDAFGRFRTGLDGGDLTSLVDLPPATMELRRQLVRPCAVEGWNGALSLPKPDDVALVAGSCWLLRIPAEHAPATLEALARLEAEGVGERRAEGFGVLSVCDPAHWRLNEMEQEQPE